MQCIELQPRVQPELNFNVIKHLVFCVTSTAASFTVACNCSFLGWLGEEFDPYKSASPLPRSRDVTATGPTPSCLLLPKQP